MSLCGTRSQLFIDKLFFNFHVTSYRTPTYYEWFLQIKSLDCILHKLEHKRRRQKILVFVLIFNIQKWKYTQYWVNYFILFEWKYIVQLYSNIWICRKWKITAVTSIFYHGRRGAVPKLFDKGKIRGSKHFLCKIKLVLWIVELFRNGS